MTMKTITHALDDPDEFALQFYRVLDDVADRDMKGEAPEEAAVFQAAMQKLSALHPGENGPTQPVGAAHDAGNNWALAAYEAGMRFGVAAEAFRRSLLVRFD